MKIQVKAENGDVRTYQVSIAKRNGNGSTTVVSPSTGAPQVLRPRLYADRIYSRTWRIDRNIEQRKQFRNHRPWKYKFRITELLSGRRIRVWKASDVIDGNEWFLSGGRDRQRKTCDR